MEERVIDQTSKSSPETEGTLTLLDIWNIIKKSWIIISLCTILGGVVSAVYAVGLMKPSYVSKGTMIVQAYDGSSGQGSAVGEQNTAVSLSIKIAASVQKLVTQDSITRQVAKDVYNDESLYSRIAAGVSSSYEVSHFYVELSYRSGDKEKTKQVVQKLISYTIDYCNSEGVYQNHDKKNLLCNSVFPLEYERNEAGEIDKTTPYASDPAQTGTSKKLVIIIGLLAGLVVGFLVAFIKELCSDKVDGKKEIEERLGIEVIGIIPDFASKNSALYKYKHHSGEAK